MKKTLLLSLLICNLWSFSWSWHLKHVGLNESYRVLHLSTHFSRVFLSISAKSRRFPTLIESLWPEKYLPTMTSIYPRKELHDKGDHRDCSRMQQAHWSQVDNLSRLWVLDVGWNGDEVDESKKKKAVESKQKPHMCPPKIFVFDLIRNNVEVLHIDCSRYLSPGGADILTVKLGPIPSRCGVEKYIYFLLADDSHILAYDILEQTWQRRLLLSRKYDSILESLPIQPLDLAFSRSNEMLIADVGGLLYRTNNALLLDGANAISLDRHQPSVADLAIEMDPIGSLLGPPKGMMIDLRHGELYYAVPKFGAVVRCEPKVNLTAEGNEIIYMTSKNVQQLFFGSHGSVWLLTDRWLTPQDNCFPTD